ncbi:Hypothetical predicted protein [Lecanosticta acicola]|uniref:Chitin-binding type-4 domain-containing protein n=1 Tax=Lecanosticta acicola TaxID=111012 RepID=A0AAI8YV91_9PEZI|nr:Hypothetical predicted protein [Lecanosticta acicola]
MKLTIPSSLLTLAVLANAHGYFESPIGRQPGDAFKAACGQQAYDMMQADINGNIQGLEQLTANQADYKASECELWKCKGMKYTDNTAQVQTYKAGEKVPLYFNIRAPHDGYANVSIIDTTSNAILAANLSAWDRYALTEVPIKTTWTNFTVTMPTDLGSKCASAGTCAIQMHWNAQSINQTYQSCIDFTMAGSSKGRRKRHAREFA